MSLVDWSIVAVFFVSLVGIGIYSRRFVRSVGDYLAANRCAGRYMLAMSDHAAWFGVIVLIAEFEKFYVTGFTGSWWNLMQAPLWLVLTVSGWIIYRYRETRALTMSQFLEMRYSRNFRIFTGMLAFISGILHYGIYPAVAGRFFIYFCKLPVHTVMVGPIEINVTLAIVMACLLTFSLIFTLSSGQIAILIGNFIQGQFLNIAFIVVLFVFIFHIDFAHMSEVLLAQPEGKSMVNPYQTFENSDFNPWFFLMVTFTSFYMWKAWVGTQGFNSAPKSPHEAKMAGIISGWRSGVVMVFMMIIPVGVFTIMQHPAYEIEAAMIKSVIEQVNDPQIEKQLTVTVGLSNVLPIGILGLFAAAMFAAAVSTDNTSVQNWGAVFIQDVLLPLRRRPFSTREHIFFLRLSAIGVALFAWTFSILFPLRDYVYMFMAITGGIYLAGAGCVIIGGLYWSRGTTAGAWAGMVTGSGFAIGGMLLQNVLWPVFVGSGQRNPDSFLAKLPEKFWLNGMEIFFWGAVLATIAYVLISLLTKPIAGFDLDALLNRKSKAPDAETNDAPKAAKWLERLGMSDEFSKSDKFLFYLLIVWQLGWFGVFIAGTIFENTFGFSDDSWLQFWMLQTGLFLVIGLFTTVWFLFGGIRDMRQMLKDLSDPNRDLGDNGTVGEQGGLGEASAEPKKVDPLQEVELRHSKSCESLD